MSGRPRPSAFRRLRLAPLTLLWLGLALRLYRLDGQSLWSDEGNSLALTQTSFAEIAARTALDIHPPLYYWLLKVWVSLVGPSEFGARALSAFLGVVLIALIYHLGRRLFSPNVGVLAALLAAVSPFQIYYSQEARMYLLLAVLTTLAVAWAWAIYQRASPLALAAYLLTVTAGLYTQYLFPLILLIINLAALSLLWRKPRRLLAWWGWHLVPLILYLPWLPIAYRQLTTWPTSLLNPAPFSERLATVFAHLNFGPTAEVLLGAWPEVSVLGLIWVLIIVVSTRKPQRKPLERAVALSALWLVLPLAVMTWLYRPAYLKFLLIAQPALCLLLGVAMARFAVGLGVPEKRWARLVGAAFSLLLLTPHLFGLSAVYQHPHLQRDDYRGIVAFLSAVATANDAVIVHAPGQIEVFDYYATTSQLTAPVYPLPQSRPLDWPATEAQLESIAQQSERIFGVFWATQEADPEGLLESWLNQNTFKASDLWFGKVRLVSYASPPHVTQFTPADFQFGPHIRLTGYSLPPSESLVAGQILPLNLRWETSALLENDYTVFVQLLDEANHLVGQRDAPPRVPTTAWSPGQVVTDSHGVFVEPGTPLRSVRLVVGLYQASTGARLPLTAGGSGDFATLATLNIAPPPSPLPATAFSPAYPLPGLPGSPLLGYNLHKLGFASQPETPLSPGDPLHLTLYWQTPTSPLPSEPLTIRLLNASDAVISEWHLPPAGVDYPPSAWQAGEIVRAQFTLFLGQVESGSYRLSFSLSEQSLGQTHRFRVE